MVAAGSTSPASVYIGLVIVIVSVSWAAWSSAGGLVRAVSGGSSAGAAADSTRLRAASKGGASATGAAKAGGDGGGSPGAAALAAASYADDDAEEGGRAQVWGSGRSVTAAAAAAAASPGGAKAGAGAGAVDADAADAPDRQAWIFHLVMAFAGLYLAMLVTNWGDISQINVQNGNPELSLASMWVRIGSQWLIYALYTWTLVAPIVCSGRDFS
jgi:hypothetical protein